MKFIGRITKCMNEEYFNWLKFIFIMVNTTKERRKKDILAKFLELNGFGLSFHLL